ncbi:unnamed protein product [Lymnaea stagnalis]|uniref:Uncharacterized protein n=1 Tax=Lymnaea stagnalis TaxID=6523 RepID=A0AAV2HQX7_LYMST
MSVHGGDNYPSLVFVTTIWLSVVLHIVGVATPEWSSYHTPQLSATYGLWGYCVNGKCGEYRYAGKLPPPMEYSLKVCEVFAVLGLLASFLGLAMATVALLLPMMGKPKSAMFPVISLLSCVATFIFILIATIVWRVKMNNIFIVDFQIGYSFILSIIGGIMICMGGVLFYLANRGVSHNYIPIV